MAVTDNSGGGRQTGRQAVGVSLPRWVQLLILRLAESLFPATRLLPCLVRIAD